jgi:hypothetical protein
LTDKLLIIAKVKLLRSRWFFKLESNHQGYCETTSSYFLGGLIHSISMYYTFTLEYNKINLIPIGSNDWDFDHSMVFNLDDHSELNLSHSNDNNYSTLLKKCYVN